MGRAREKHRETMENYLGRALDYGEAVKRCDNNPENNSIENLELVAKFSRKIKKQQYIKVRINGRTYLKHRVVMEQYLGRALDPDEYVHHCDENFYNNDISNLDIISPKEHAVLHYTKNPHKYHVRWGEENPRSKLTGTDVKDIWIRINRKEKLVDIARIYKVHKNTIAKIKRGVNWKHANPTHRPLKPS